MSTLNVGLLVALLYCTVAQVASECCAGSSHSDFCQVFRMLSTMEQHEVMAYIGDDCEGDADEAIKTMEKRKPNFIRYGRSTGQAPIDLGKKGSDPNFLRFGRSTKTNFLRFGKSNADPNFLRFGRAGADPNFLRFGKRSGGDPNFLRFGKSASADPNFLRFGRSSNFEREERKPNFLRFGK